MNTAPRYIIAGVGGHAHSILEAVRRVGGSVVAYVDPRANPDLGAVHFTRDEDAIGYLEQHSDVSLLIGMGGVSPRSLAARFELFERYRACGARAPGFAFPSAEISESARLGDGALAMTRTVLHPNADIGPAAIINTGAIIEHDAVIGPGAHIAPGAIILGGARVGAACMVGAGAIVLPGSDVPDGTLVPALGRT